MLNLWVDSSINRSDTKTLLPIYMCVLTSLRAFLLLSSLSHSWNLCARWHLSLRVTQPWIKRRRSGRSWGGGRKPLHCLEADCRTRSSSPSSSKSWDPSLELSASWMLQTLRSLGHRALMTWEVRLVPTGKGRAHWSMWEGATERGIYWVLLNLREISFSFCFLLKSALVVHLTQLIPGDILTIMILYNLHLSTRLDFHHMKIITLVRIHALRFFLSPSSENTIFCATLEETEP